MSDRRVLALAVTASALVVFGGCGAGAPLKAGLKGPERAELDRLVGQQRQAQSELDETLKDMQASSDDRCRRICLHYGQICKLSTRICSIAQRHRGAPEAQVACRDARRTCDQATAKLPPECGCPEREASR